MSLMTVNDFHNRTTADLSSDIRQTLSPVVKSLCKMFTRIELRWKRGRIVPILLTSDILQAMNTLVSERARCGIKPDNNYMFAMYHSITTVCVEVIVCAVCLYKVRRCLSGEIALNKTAQHVASLSQVLNLKNKCSAVDEMGDSLATIDMGRKLGCVPLLEGELGPIVTQCGLGRDVYLRISGILIHLYKVDEVGDSSATTDMGRNLGWGLCHLGWSWVRI